MYFYCAMINAQSTDTSVVVEAMEAPTMINVAVVVERVIEDAHTSLVQ